MGTWSKQDEVASLSQLRAEGMTLGQIRSRVRNGRWQSPLRGVVIMHSGSPTPRQRMWSAVLWAGDESALCAATAAELDGLRGYADWRIHVEVPSHQRPRPTRGIVVHRSRTLVRSEIVARRFPARVCGDRALVQLATSKLRSDDACAVLAAGVQQRVTTADQLLVRVRADRHLPHRKELLAALTDIEGGSQSIEELRVLKLIRAAGLPEPRRQAQIMIGGVPRIVDLYWDEFDAGAEILGGFHRGVDHWWNDLRRMAEIQSTGTPLFPIPTVALRREPDAVMELLRQFLISRGWQPPQEIAPKSGLKVVLQRDRGSTLRRSCAEG